MTWLNLLILIALIAGHAELWVTIVNRMYGTKLPKVLLHRLRRLHDGMILLFPVLVLWLVGFQGVKLLRGGSWNELGLGWRIVFSLCGLGFLGQVWSSLRWQFRRPVSAEQNSQSQIVNIGQRLREPLVDKGPYLFLTRIPRNQIDQVEVVEKTFLLPHLPLEWNGVSILHLTDWHLLGTIRREFFEEVCELCTKTKPDLIMFTGDLMDNMQLLDWLPRTLGKLHAPLGRFFILGNHDWYLEPETIRQALRDIGWINLGNRVETLDQQGSRVALGGSEVPWMGEHPDFSSIPNDTFRILLSHTPDNYRWAQLAGVDLMLSGHNHGGQVVLPIIGPIYSPSIHGVKYAGGAFLERETLLYVSRGLSARHPLRINCRPEITLIVLKSAAHPTKPDQKIELISQNK